MVSKEKGTTRFEVPFVGLPSIGGAPIKRGPSMGSKIMMLWDYCRELMGQKMPDCVVIESQYGHKQCSIAHGLQGMFLAQNIPVHMVAPISLNTRANRLKKRYGLNQTVMLQANKRTSDKLSHVWLWRQLCPEEARKDLRAGIKEDDMADAFIYALDALVQYVDEEWRIIEQWGGIQTSQ